LFSQSLVALSATDEQSISSNFARKVFLRNFLGVFCPKNSGLSHHHNFHSKTPLRILEFAASRPSHLQYGSDAAQIGG